MTDSRIPTAPPELLRAQAITLAYNAAPVVRDVSLAIHAGTFIGLIGANGAGKTTLLLALSGQFQPARGSVRFRGTDAYEDNLAYKRRIGFVHEKPFFYPYLTASEFLHFVARVKGIATEDAEPQIGTLLERVYLAAERDKLTSSLSMGMEKKLALAAAMLGEPALLFLDEALNGIDLESAYGIKKTLRSFVEAGGTVVLSTHVLEVLEKICDRYLIMRRGAIVADVQAAEVATGAIDLESFVLDVLRE